MIPAWEIESWEEAERLAEEAAPRQHLDARAVRFYLSCPSVRFDLAPFEWKGSR